MFWRIIHDALKWLGISFFPAIGFTLVAGLGLASSFPETKPWLAQRFADALAVMEHPAFWAVAALVFVAWLVALIWSGHKAGSRESGDTHIHHYYAPLPDFLPNQQAVTAQINAVEDGDTMAATGVVGLSGLYVGNIIAAASNLHDKHRLELAIIGFNGASEAILVSGVSGHIKVGDGNLRDMVALETPATRGMARAEPGGEFVMVLIQALTPAESDEFLAALDGDKRLQLDLRSLHITVTSVSDISRSTRLPLWDAVALRRRDDIVSNRVTNMGIQATSETSVSLGMLVARVDGTTEKRDA